MSWWRENFHHELSCSGQHFYTPPFVWQGIMLYPPNRLSVHPSVRINRRQGHIGLYVHPSITASFPGSNFSIFWPIFFKLCIGIDIREERFGIASGLISFRNNRVMALDLCTKCVFPQYLENKWMNFDKILYMHWYICDLGLVNYILIFFKFSTELWPLINVRI